jgi:membrane protein DedA with SNARE-associated domain
MHMVEAWLATLPPLVIYLLIFVVIGMESLGIPLPGEIALVSAALLAVTGVTSVWWVALAASLGAVIGDSIGYVIGRRGGRALLERLGRRFPKHLGPPHLAKAERTFERWGVWAVFFGRFVALLRILAGPLAGALHVPYGKFLIANATGGIIWASGTSFAIYYAGQAAERWLRNFSWVALLVAVLCGIASTLYLRRRAHRSFAAAEATHAEAADSADTDQPAAESGATTP